LRTRQWYIANFARSRASRSPRRLFHYPPLAKLGHDLKYLRVIGQQENSYISYIVYIAAWQTYWQTENITSRRRYRVRAK